MTRFSEKYGYNKVSDVLIREEIPEPIMNSILNCFYDYEIFQRATYYDIEKSVWIYFLNRKLCDYENNGYGRTVVIASTFNDKRIKWYEKLDLIEFILSKIKSYDKDKWLVNRLNGEFQRHNFAYRIIGDRVEEITSKVEIESIEDALLNEHKGVKTHLQAALGFLSVTNETPNYRNSIKESISAVEACCRSITGENTLGEALNSLGKSGINIQPQLKLGFDKIYAYTNNHQTGIRHPLMEDDYTPNSDEAIFMLIACSAFINYLTKKNNKIK